MDERQIKSEFLKLIREGIQNKLDDLYASVKSLEESLLSETKSSAGDKHETGRAMIQLEREQLGRQLSEMESQYEIISKIDSTSKNEIISLGSYVETPGVNYFISTSIGKLQYQQFTCYAMSKESPIGKLLIGKRKGEIVKFRESSMEILSVY